MTLASRCDGGLVQTKGPGARSMRNLPVMNARPGTTARLLVGALIATVTLLASPAPAATPATTYATQTFKATNQERDERDLIVLRKNKCLQRFANAQARKMAEEGQLSHQSLTRIQKRCGMGHVGENVAFGYPTGTATVAAWMKSPMHRANILFPKFRLMAISARKAEGQWWVAQVFGRKG